MQKLLIFWFTFVLIFGFLNGSNQHPFCNPNHRLGQPGLLPWDALREDLFHFAQLKGGRVKP